MCLSPEPIAQVTNHTLDKATLRLLFNSWYRSR